MPVEKKKITENSYTDCLLSVSHSSLNSHVFYCFKYGEETWMLRKEEEGTKALKCGFGERWKVDRLRKYGRNNAMLGTI